MYCQVWWPILEIGALHLTHPSAHTQQWVVNMHPEQWAAIAPAPGEQLGGSVPCSRAPQSWYWGWRECSSFTIPTFNPCRTWDSNPQPLDYKTFGLQMSDRLRSALSLLYIAYSPFRIFNKSLVFHAAKRTNVATCCTCNKLWEVTSAYSLEIAMTLC